MLSESEAVSRILAAISPLPCQRVPLSMALHGFTPQAVQARVPLPGFDNSAMDGYAVRAADTQSSEPLQVTGAVAAGAQADLMVEPQCAVRIFTGAPMPAGADAVIMQEDVSRLNDGLQILCNEPVAPGENVRLLGCDLCVGQRIVHAGDRLTPARLAALASQGLAELEMASAPRIAILSTGDELTPPGKPLPPGRIYNSNATLLEALVREQCPQAQVTTHLVADDLMRTTEALRELTRDKDFIIISGGVSVGEHDFVKPALQALGIKADFWRVKVKPGKPFLFARTEESARPCHLFGLPGNPVSAYVTFQLFVRPALLRALGASDHEAALPQVMATLTAPVRNRGDRPHYLRGRHEAGRFTPTGVQQSHALYGLSQANALLRLEPEQELFAEATVTALLCGA